MKLYSWRNPDRLTLKLRIVTHDLPIWLEKHNRFLLLYSEQALETLHSFYSLHELHWKVPVTGMQKLVREETRHTALMSRRFVRIEHDDVHTPSEGTRSGKSASQKKRRVQVVAGGVARGEVTQFSGVVGPAFKEAVPDWSAGTLRAATL